MNDEKTLTKERLDALQAKAQEFAAEGVTARVYGAQTAAAKPSSYKGKIVAIDGDTALQELNAKGSYVSHQADGLAVGDVVNIGYDKGARTIAPFVPGEKVERPARATPAVREPKEAILESNASESKPTPEKTAKPAVKRSPADINNEIVRKAVEPVIKSMKEGNSIFHKTWSTPAEECMPHNATTGKRYQGANTVFLLTYLMATDSNDTRFMTYKQGQTMRAAMAKDGTPEDQLPKLREGAKGIFLTKFGQAPGRKSNVLDEDGKPVLDDDGNAKVKESRGRAFLQGFHVFHASDFDNMPAMKLAEPRAEWEVHAEAETLMQKSGVEIREVYGDRAFYSPTQDAITSPTRQQFANANDFYSVILHEIGHSTGHSSRLCRPGIDKFDHFGSKQYAGEEMTAELTSVIVMAQMELQSDANIKNHAGYLTGWESRIEDDPKCFITACNEASQASEWVFGRHSKQLEAQATMAQETGLVMSNDVTAPSASSDFLASLRADQTKPVEQTAGMSM